MPVDRCRLAPRQRPRAYANLMQTWLEPLLQRQAEARAPGGLRFNHGFVSLEQDAAGIVATIEDRAAALHYQVRARYLLACDGRPRRGPQLGVRMDGSLAVATNVSVHFSADLSRWARGPDVLVRTLFNPDTGTPWALVPVGPDRWTPDSREWVLHFISFPGDHKRYDRDETQAARTGARRERPARLAAARAMAGRDGRAHGPSH